MEVLDTTVVNVSLPHIAGSLSVTPEEATWALTSYLVANAIVLPITGWLANYIGRKRLLMSAVVGFTCVVSCVASRRISLARYFSHRPGIDGRCSAAVSQAVMLEAFPRAARKSNGILGIGNRRRADARTGTGRLAHRQLFVAMGVLRQYPGGHRFDHHDEDVHLRPAIHPSHGRESRYLGHRNARSRNRRPQIVLDKGQQEDWFVLEVDQIARRAFHLDAAALYRP